MVLVGFRVHIRWTKPLQNIQTSLQTLIFFEFVKQNEKAISKESSQMGLIREQCLAKIRTYYDSNLIKVLTEIRSGGKKRLAGTNQIGGHQKRCHWRKPYHRDQLWGCKILKTHQQHQTESLHPEQDHRSEQVLSLPRWNPARQTIRKSARLSESRSERFHLCHREQF